MTDQEIRERLARELGLSDTSERFVAIWNQLRDEGNVPLGADDEEGWDTAIVEGKRFIAYEEKRGGQVRRPREPDKEIKASLEEAESRRANAMMLYWAKNAACEREVRSFRERILNNRLLTREEAYKFLQSPLLKVFSQSKIEEANVPIIGHSASWRRKDMEKVEAGFYWHIEVSVEPPATELHYDRITTEPLEHLWYPDKNGWGDAADVWPQSVMQDLLRTSKIIAERYGWGKGQAPIFILTDIVPLTHALSYTIDHDALGRQTISMTIEPWVTKGTVLRAYSQAQQKIYSSVPGPIGEQSAALFEFVIERMGADGKIPSMRALMREWNQGSRTPDARKYIDARLFERDYNRAKQSLLHPRLRVHPPKSFEEMTPAEQMVARLREHSDSHPDSQDE